MRLLLLLALLVFAGFASASAGDCADPKAIKAFERCMAEDTNIKKTIAACEEATRIHPLYADAHAALVEFYIHTDDEEGRRTKLQL